MKKTKSVSLIKIPSLAASEKKSVQLNTNAPLWPRMTATNSIKNLVITKPLKQFYNELQTDATSNQDTGHINMTYTRPAAILSNKLNSLHAAIDCLQQEIAETRQFGKNKGKDYQQQLKKHEEITKSIKVCESQINFNKEKLSEIGNSICMLQQDYHSSQVNIQQTLAEKQYCDQILDQYKREHENEATLVLQSLQKQSQNISLKKQIKKLEEEVVKNEKCLSDWKMEIQFDLQDKKQRNKVTQLRIDLMKAQEQANNYAAAKKLIKIRQILCIHLKQIGEASKYWMEATSEEGLQMLICRNGGLQNFEQAVLGYKSRENTKYEAKAIQPYFSILHKIEQTLSNPRTTLHKKINSQYINQLSKLRHKIHEKQSMYENNEKRIKQWSQKIQLVFANDSVAIIQHLRQSAGRYDISSIKSTLKQLKSEQKQRIMKIKDVFWGSERINKGCFQVEHVWWMNQLVGLKDRKAKFSGVVANLQSNYKNLCAIKENIENQISMAVSKWGELSCKKEQLKQLYKDLNKLNKQIREADLLRFKQKQSPHNAFKQKQDQFHISKRSELLSKCMRQTLKLRINGTTKQNKQNIPIKNIEKTETLQKSDTKTFRNKLVGNTNFEENCRTRKSSLVDPNNKTLQVNNKFGRDSLTAVLFSKFAF